MPGRRYLVRSLLALAAIGCRSFDLEEARLADLPTAKLPPLRLEIDVQSLRIAYGSGRLFAPNSAVWESHVLPASWLVDGNYLIEPGWIETLDLTGFWFRQLPSRFPADKALPAKNYTYVRGDPLPTDGYLIAAFSVEPRRDLFGFELERIYFSDAQQVLEREVPRFLDAVSTWVPSGEGGTGTLRVRVGSVWNPDRSMSPAVLPSAVLLAIPFLLGAPAANTRSEMLVAIDVLDADRDLVATYHALGESTCTEAMYWGYHGLTCLRRSASMPLIDALEQIRLRMQPHLPELRRKLLEAPPPPGHTR